jgi:hypothetical protein
VYKSDGPHSVLDRAEIRRTWRIGFEGWGIALTQSEQRECARWIGDEPASTQPVRRRVRRPIAAGLAVLGATLASTAGWAVWANAPRPSAELRAEIPEALQPEKPARPASRPVAALRTPIKPAPAPVQSEEQAIGAALTRAFSTGEAQDWSARGRQGIVVVGDLSKDEDGRRCREVAVLSRDGGFTGQVDSSRACMDEKQGLQTERTLPKDKS